MVIFAYPDTLLNMSVEAVGVYVSDLMQCLITDPSCKRGPDGKYHHHQEACSHLEASINCYVPRYFAREFTQRLIRYVSICYKKTINEGFRSTCEEIAPYVLKSVIHQSVKCLDFIRDSSHPTMLDYYKQIEPDLIYRTFPLLHDLKALRLGKMFRFINIPLEVEGFRNSLEEFSCRNFWPRDLIAISDKCKNVRRLEIGGSLNYPSRIFDLISRFKYLEELNISRLHFISEKELWRILQWLAGSVDEESSDAPEGFVTGAEGTSNASVAVSYPAFSSRTSGLLKSFGCVNATDEHIKIISQFYNLTSLVLAHPASTESLASLSSLKVLKKITLSRTIFHEAEQVLKSIGNQLTCLSLIDVRNTDFAFISDNCRSLECLHLYFSFPHHLMLTEKYPNRESHSLPVPEFPHVVALQLYLTAPSARQFVLNHFPNLKKLSLVFTGDDSVLLDSLIQRKVLTRLEELYWGNDTVIQFSGSTTTKTIFDSDGKVSVQHIRT